MTILFAGTERPAFQISSGAFTTTEAGNFDAAYSRSALRVDTSISRIEAFFDASAASIYISYRLDHDNPTEVSRNDTRAFSLWEGTTELFRIQPTNAIWQVFTFDGGAQLRATITPAILAGAFRWTIRFNLSVSGGFDLWINNDLRATFSGDTIGDTGATVIDKADWQGSRTVVNSRDQAISEVVVATTHTINMRVATLVPEADGTNNDWANGFAEVDEVGADITDNITSTVADEVETMNLTNYGGTTTFSVLSVSVAVQGSRGETGPQSLQVAIRSGSTDAFSATKALTEVYADHTNRWDTNPDTSNPWTIAEIDALQAGVKSIA